MDDADISSNEETHRESDPPPPSGMMTKIRKICTHFPGESYPNLFQRMWSQPHSHILIVVEKPQILLSYSSPITPPPPPPTSPGESYPNLFQRMWTQPHSHILIMTVSIDVTEKSPSPDSSILILSHQPPPPPIAESKTRYNHGATNTL